MRLAGKSLLFLFVSTAAFAQFPSPLKNVVVIVQENRTPDNLFHFLSPLCPLITTTTVGLNSCIPAASTSCYDISPCGLSNQSGTEQIITLSGTTLSGSVDPNHTHTGFEEMCDPDSSFGCQNDGAWQTSASNGSYAYVENPAVTNYDGSTGHLLDPYLTFAEQYGWANFMYQTNQGPSYPAHQFLFSGTSALTNSDDANSIFVSENFTGSNNVGCLLPASTSSDPVFSDLLQPANGQTGCTLWDAGSVQECQLDNTLVGNVGTYCTNKNNMGQTVLDANSIKWKYYAPNAGSIWTAPNSIQSICDPQPNGSGGLACAGTEWTADVDVQNYGTDILEDITNCKLRPVSWVIPNGAWSDHASDDDKYGPSWVTAIINEIGTNPTCASGTQDAGQTFWQNTVVVVTWDDWGGWSDNQPANVQGGLPCVFTTPATPCPGDYQYGFRVPLIIVSAYTPVGLINDDNHDFGSILRMIEGINGVTEGLMGNADDRSKNDLHGFFDVNQAMRTYVPVPAVEPASFFTSYSGAVEAPDTD